MRRMSATLAAVGAAALIGLTGCGSQGAEPLRNVELSAAEVLQDSAQKSTQVNTYTADIVAEINGGRQGTGKIQGTMVLQQQPSLAADITFDQVSFGDQALPGGMRSILLGETLYLKVDALRTLTGDAKPWVKVDLNEAGAQSGVNFQDLLTQARQYDLANSVKMLTASQDVKAVGTETVGGVETTHYSGTFPVEAALSQLSPEVREHARAQMAELRDMKFDAWIDAEGLPRKISMSGTAGEGSISTTMQFRAFNEQVNISEPPADQVGELPKGGTD